MRRRELPVGLLESLMITISLPLPLDPCVLAIERGSARFENLMQLKWQRLSRNVVRVMASAAQASGRRVRVDPVAFCYSASRLLGRAGRGRQVNRLSKGETRT
jgi:hypothetical protein